MDMIWSLNKAYHFFFRIEKVHMKRNHESRQWEKKKNYFDCGCGEFECANWGDAMLLWELMRSVCVCVKCMLWISCQRGV